MAGNLFFFTALFAFCNVTSSFRILLMPLLGRSHLMSLYYIGEGLVERGHEAFILVPDYLKNSPDLANSNASGISVVLYGEEVTKELGPADFDGTIRNLTEWMLENEAGMMQVSKLLQPVAEAERRRLLDKNEAMLDRVRALNFDVAVVDHVVFMDYGYLIPHSLGVPWVTYADAIQPWVVRVPFLPSFVPIKFVPFSDRMSFVERLINTFVYVGVTAFIGMSSVPENLVAKYKRHGDFGSMDDLQSRSLLYISTSDIALDYAMPSMPNLIHAGGLSVKPTQGKALPKDFEEFMASSNANGVILVTFGSMVSTLPHRIVRKLIDAFEQLSEYKIIWRFVNRDKLEMPKNVMLAKWLPQNDILSDPRIRLFITHCGNNGQFEAVYHAVPMVGFPLFGDQHYNGRRLPYKGYGMSMDIHKFTAQELVENARTIIGDESYKARVSKASEIFKSARDTPVERAAYWIEHVTKFGGAHLRSAGNDLALYQYLMLDILLVVGVVIVTSFACVCKLTQMTWRKCRSVKGRAKKKSD